jgi:hypothetical protein
VDDATELVAQPKSCNQVDLVAQLQISPDAIDCGDLPVDAASDASAAALKCARAALAASKPFQLFWATRGTDGVNHAGVVGRLENGVLHTYTVGLITADSFGGTPGNESAWWLECGAFGSSTCTSGPEECLSCTSGNDRNCMCSPDYDPSGVPTGKGPNVSCVINLD